MKKIVLIIFVIFYQNSFSQKIILHDSIIEQLEIITKKDAKYRDLIFLENKKINSKKKIDSLWILQYALDLENIQKLLKILKKYGYVDAGNSNAKFPLFVILMHTPIAYNKEVFEIVEKERKKGNIDYATYDMIVWHLKDRKGFPFKLNYYAKDSIKQ